MDVNKEIQESAYPPPAVGWSAVSIFTVLYILSYADRKLLSLMVEPIKHDLGINDFQFGILQGFAFALLYAMVGIPIGRMVDRYSRRKIVYIGVTFWSIATALSGFTHNFITMLLARCGVGVGEATLSPSAYSMISDLFPKHKLAGALGVYGIGVTIGSGLAYVLGGWLISVLSGDTLIHLGALGDFKPWQLAFLAAGLPGIALAFLIFLVPEPVRKGKMAEPTKEAPSKPSILLFMRERFPFLVCHFLGFSMIGLWSFSVGAWAPAFLGREFGWEPWRIGIGLGIYAGCFGTIGALVGGRIVDACVRRGIKDAQLRVPLYSTLIAIPFGVSAFLVSDGYTSILLLSLMQVFLLMFAGPAVGSLQAVTPNEFRGQITAIYLFVVSIIGSGFGPVAVGAITDFWFEDSAKVGLSLAALIAICGPLAVVCLALGLAPMRRAVGLAERWS